MKRLGIALPVIVNGFVGSLSSHLTCFDGFWLDGAMVLSLKVQMPELMP